MVYEQRRDFVTDQSHAHDLGDALNRKTGRELTHGLRRHLKKVSLSTSASSSISILRVIFIEQHRKTIPNPTTQNSEEKDP